MERGPPPSGPALSPCGGVRLRRRASQVALHRGLAGEIDATLAVDLGHYDHDLVAYRDHVLDRGDVVVGQLADPDQAFLTGEDLDEAAEAHDPGDLAQIQTADLYVAGQRLDPLDRLARVLTRHCCDLDRAVVLDVDLGAGFLLDLADHGAALADDVADLLGVDLDGDDARRVVAHLGAARRDDRVHLVEDGHSGFVGLLEAGPNDRLVDALDLDVHLESGHALAGAGDLEVHVAEGVFFTEDVGQDGEAAVGLADEAHRRTGDGGLDRHAGVHERKARAAGRCHRGRAVRRHALTDEADDVRELVLGRENWNESPLGEVAVADFTPTCAAHRLVLAGAVGRHVVVVEIPLLRLGADCVDPLNVRRGAERGDGERLGLAAGEKAGTVGSRQDADFHRDLPELVHAAALHADALVEDHAANGLLVDQVEQVLAHARLAASRLQKRGGVLALLAVGPDGDGDAILDGRHTTGEFFGEASEHGGRRLGIGEAAMSGLDGD